MTSLWDSASARFAMDEPRGGHIPFSPQLLNWLNNQIKAMKMFVVPMFRFSISIGIYDCLLQTRRL